MIACVLLSRVFGTDYQLRLKIRLIDRSRPGRNMFRASVCLITTNNPCRALTIGGQRGFLAGSYSAFLETGENWRKNDKETANMKNVFV